MQIRPTRNGVIMTIVVTAAIAAATVAVVLPNDAAAGSGDDESATSPDTVLTRVPQNTPGGWTPEEMDQAEPMPLLSPDHPARPAGSRTPAARPGLSREPAATAAQRGRPGYASVSFAVEQLRLSRRSPHNRDGVPVHEGLSLGAAAPLAPVDRRGREPGGILRLARRRDPLIVAQP